MRTKLTIALGLAVVTAPALAAVDFSQLDQDKDKRLSREELANSQAFERWDSDGDGRLSKQELSTNQQAIDQSLIRQQNQQQAQTSGQSQQAQGGGQAAGSGQGQGSGQQQAQSGMSRDEYYDAVILSYDQNSDSWLDADEWPEDGIWE